MLKGINREGLLMDENALKRVDGARSAVQEAE
jgi:hypothetical protein